MNRPLRIAQVAPPLEPVPPRGYGGTERIVAALVDELTRRGHEVTTFASGDSTVAGRRVTTVERALRPAGVRGDWSPWFFSTIRTVLDHADDFDVIHSHLEWASPVLALASRVPVVSTFHGRLDVPWAERLLEHLPGLVAISRSQAATHPTVRWAATIHNGLPLANAPFHVERDDALVFVGRIAPEKGILDAIAVARLTERPLRVIAKRPVVTSEVEYFDEVFLPALRATGSLVEDLGELSGAERDDVVASSHALIMPGTWPEPFGLAAIEALACGTPVLTRRVGALPEIVRDGIDGFFGDDVEHLAFLVDRVVGLDRHAIRASVIERFSAEGMTDAYEALYRRTLIEVDERAPVRVPIAVGPGRAVTFDDAPDAERGEDGLPPLRDMGRRAARIELQGRS
jgi:glycosyltransferase involved in cell wall biosynthesis